MAFDDGVLLGELFQRVRQVYGTTPAALVLARCRAEVEERYDYAVLSLIVPDEWSAAWLCPRRHALADMITAITGRSYVLDIVIDSTRSLLRDRERDAHMRWHDDNRLRPAPPGRVDYHAYLLSHEWIAFRDSVLRAWQRTCAHCGISGVRLDVHHYHYDSLGWESIEDVAPLCESCHLAADQRRVQEKMYRVSKAREYVR